MCVCIIDPFFLPLDVRLAAVGQEFLKFEWSPALNNCVSLLYEINATESCGSCPGPTKLTSVSCTINASITDSEVCRFAVRAIMCDNITGSWSALVKVPLKGIIQSYTIQLHTADQFIQFQI